MVQFDVPPPSGDGGQLAMWAHSPGGRESPIDAMTAEAITLECVVPMSHTPGQKMSWISPTGQRVALLIPLNAHAGQTLEFDIPLSVLEEAPPDPLAGEETLTLEVDIPSGWIEGKKLLTQLGTGSKVVIVPPPGSQPGMSLEFRVARREVEQSSMAVTAQCSAPDHMPVSEGASGRQCTVPSDSDRRRPFSHNIAS